ncbi:MAG: hypothetical protein MJ146_03005 [Clostridia bacterium]|nr:hypothetical protein [Clostridia bacterium]
MNIKNVIKVSGGFVAWVIGSGFATGQEILQFFTSYGYGSYGVVIVNLIGFLVVGPMLLGVGYAKREQNEFKHFDYYCGKKLGTFYSWATTITLIFVMAVLISGAGATLSEYYGLNHYVGAAIMAVMILIAYLLGFEKLIKILGFIGPSIICFCLLIGLITVFRDFSNIDQVPLYADNLAKSQSSPNWVISSVLYVSYNFLCGSTYYTALGASCTSKKEARAGAILGAIALILAIAVMNTAILSNAGDTASLAIPTLYLAKKISYILGAVFSIFLILGIYSSCSAMMWTVCTKFATGDKKKDRIIAFSIAIGTFILGLFSFSKLIGLFYPIIGYAGILFIGCVIYKKFEKKKDIC